MNLRAVELIEGGDGKLDEQSMLSILLGLTLIGLTIYSVVWQHVEFHPLEFAGTCSAFLGGSLGSLTMRSRWGKSGNGPAA